MFTRADIRRVGMVVTAGDYSAVMVSLGKSGIVHTDGSLSDMAAGTSPSYADPAVSERIILAANNFLDETGAAGTDSSYYKRLLDDIPSIFARDIVKETAEAEKISGKVKQYAGVRQRLMELVKIQETKLALIRKLRDDGIEIPLLRTPKNVSYILASAGTRERPDTVDKRIFCICSKDYIVALFPPELKESLAAWLNARGCTDLDYAVRPGFSLDDEESAAVSRIAELNNRIERIDLFYNRSLAAWQERMRYLAAAYSILMRINGEESRLSFSDEVAVINGWINADDEGTLVQLLRNVCTSGFYCKTWSRAESRKSGEIMPVLLRNSRVFRPFELLVRMMGMPGNSEVDPTPAAAIAYVIIFGVMFGDTGQGLVLALTGLLLNRYGMKRYRARNNISDFGSIMTWCGFSASMFGILYGSFFSNEHLIPAVLFHPMEHMMQLLLMAIMTGAFFISAGLLLNIINGIVARDYGAALFGARGVPGLVIYLSFIFFAMRFILGGAVPAGRGITVALAVPAVVFCLRGPLGYFMLHGRHMFHNGLFEYIVETLIEVMEMFSGFLGNTISYIRAGAFALSHAGLSMAVYTLAGIIDPALKSASAIAVIVTGNIFIILLEGLVCGIQSMRLEYYEFFGKFFKGDGIAFVPFDFAFKQVKHGGQR